MAVYIYVSPTRLSSPHSWEKMQPRNLDSFCCAQCCGLLKDNKLQCICGEEWKIYEWCWESQADAINTVLSNDDREVLFHPIYSSGTAAVRGQVAFKQNVHYYWEVKMLTNLYGTDIMVGIGTAKVVLTDWRLRFCSMLGFDRESWGYSYHGTIQHNKMCRKYGPQFGLGSLVGVHLDMCAGTLEYYLNRKPLGIAFRGLKNMELYPMVSSTAAQSAIRMSCAISQVPTLQMRCLQTINRNPVLLKQYRSIPGLTRLVERKYFWLVPHVKESKAAKEEKSKLKLELEDEAVLSLPSVRCSNRQRKRLRTIRWGPYDSRTDPEHIMYKTNRVNIMLNENGNDVNKNACSDVSPIEGCETATCSNVEDVSQSAGINLKVPVHSKHFKSSEERVVPTVCTKSCNMAEAPKTVDVYDNLSDAGSDSSVAVSNFCSRCHYYLGNNCEPSSEPLCAYCDVII